MLSMISVCLENGGISFHRAVTFNRGTVLLRAGQAL